MVDEKKPISNEIKIEHGNVQVLQLQLLNRLVENTNKMIEILEKKTK